MMDKKEHTLAALRELKPEVQAKFKVKELGVFGSVIRGEERLKQKVDVVSKRALRPEIREAVLHEVSTV